MDRTLITPSFTSLYGQTEIDPLSLHALAGDYSEDIDMDMVRRMYHAKIEEAIRLIRSDWTVTLDGAPEGVELREDGIVRIAPQDEQQRYRYQIEDVDGRTARTAAEARVTLTVPLRSLTV